MAERLNQQELMEFAYESLPPVGTPIAYADWHAQIKASDHPESARYYRELKARGLVKATLTQAEDGTITHTIEKVEGGQ